MRKYIIIGFLWVLAVSPRVSSGNEPAATPSAPQPAITQTSVPQSGADDSIQKTLLANLDSFTLDFQYFPPKDGKSTELPSLTLRVPMLKDQRVANWPAVQIDKNQADTFVRHLATRGWLKRAECTNSPVRDRLPRPAPEGPVYVLRLSAGGWEFEERIAFNAQTYLRMMEIRDLAQGPAADALDKHMLAQLAAKHPAWRDAGDIASGMLKELNLTLTPVVPLAKHRFLSLWVFTGKAPPSMPRPGNLWMFPDAAEVRSIIDSLAATGVLETLEPVPPDAPIEGAYVLTICIDRKVYRKSLGWDANMRGVLETIADRLPPDGFAVRMFQEILERLEPFRAEWDKAAGLKPPPIDWDKAGDYNFGPWKYVYRFSLNRNGKVIGHSGQIVYRGKTVEGINLNDSLQTPWGPMFWVEVPKMPDGPHGWMRQGVNVRSEGRLLPSPLDAVRYHDLDSYSGRMLTLIYCSQEKVWANLFGPDVEGEMKSRTDPLSLAVRLTAQQSKALFTQAAYSGLLSKSSPKWADGYLTAGRESYLLQFTWTTKPGDEYTRQTYSIDLGPKPQATESLTGIKSVLQGKPADAIEKVLQRLAAPAASAPAPASAPTSTSP
jgi:hypothetical protein